MSENEWVTIKRHRPAEERKSIARTWTTPEEIIEEKHTPECYAKYLAWLGKHTDWVQRWPEHCERCKGAGSVDYAENQSPIGSGEYWPMHFVDLCECTEEYVCPRCGHQHEEGWGENEEPCPFCGWKWAHNPDDYAPPEYECGCWVILEKEARERETRKEKVS